MRCQTFDAAVEEAVPSDDETLATVPMASTDWCDDANQWNDDDDDDDTAKVQEKKPTPSIVAKTKKEPEVLLESMKIEEEKNEKSSSDDEDDELETKKTSKSKNKVSVASSDAFNEWKRRNLAAPSLDTTGDARFPFYYIDIDDEEAVLNDAKLQEIKKLKNKAKALEGIDEDDDDESTSKNKKE